MHTMATTVLKAEEVMDALVGADTPSFYAKFTKRTDGTIRNMLFKLPGVDDRSGVVVDTSRLMEDEKRQLITVWDVNKDTYRRLNLRDIKSLVIDNQEVMVDCN